MLLAKLREMWYELLDHTRVKQKKSWKIDRSAGTPEHSLIEKASKKKNNETVAFSRHFVEILGLLSTPKISCTFDGITVGTV